MLVQACDMQAAALEERTERGVEPVIADAVLLNDLLGAVERGRARPRCEGEGVGLLAHRTEQRGHENRRGMGIRLSVVGVPDAEDSARVFDEHVLKAATGPEQWGGSLTRVAERRA